MTTHASEIMRETIKREKTTLARSPKHQKDVEQWNHWSEWDDTQAELEKASNDLLRKTLREQRVDAQVIAPTRCATAGVGTKWDKNSAVIVGSGKAPPRLKLNTNDENVENINFTGLGRHTQRSPTNRSPTNRSPTNRSPTNRSPTNSARPVSPAASSARPVSPAASARPKSPANRSPTNRSPTSTTPTSATSQRSTFGAAGASAMHVSKGVRVDSNYKASKLTNHGKKSSDITAWKETLISTKVII